MFNIQINGEPFQCMSSMSIKALMTYLEINTELSLIEYNNEIIHEDEWINIILKPKDKLEIITIVGGG